MFNIILKSFITCCLVVGLLPSFSCLCTTKAFAQTSTSISEIFCELSGTDGYLDEDDNDQLLGTNDCLQDSYDNIQSQGESSNTQLSAENGYLGEKDQQSSSSDDILAKNQNFCVLSNVYQNSDTQSNAKNTAPDNQKNILENSQSDFNYVDYKITITTADILRAGFDGLVQVRVNGELGSTSFHTLDADSHDDFERSQTDEYSFRDRSVGAIKSLTFETDSEGDWFLQDVSMEVEGHKYFFWANFGWINGSVEIFATQEREYILDVHTLDCKFAGSGANCYVCLVGDKGYTGYYNLGEPERNETKRTSFVSRDVGKIKNVIVTNSVSDQALHNFFANGVLSDSIDLAVMAAMAIISFIVLKIRQKTLPRRISQENNYIDNLKNEINSERRKKLINGLEYNYYMDRIVGPHEHEVIRLRHMCNFNNYTNYIKGVIISIFFLKNRPIFSVVKSLEEIFFENSIDTEDSFEQSEEVRFLIAIDFLNQGLNFENPSQELSDRYLNYVKDFNRMFYDFCMNAENTKQISTQTLLYLLKFLSNLNTFEPEYSRNGFKSVDLAELGDMLFYVYYCRAGLDNPALKENSVNNGNKAKEEPTDNFINGDNYLRITKQPSKLSYVMLEPLNIEDIVLTLKIAGNDPVDIGYYDLYKYGISVNRNSGWALSLEDKALDFSYAKDNINLSVSVPIVVEPSEDIRDFVYGQGVFASCDSTFQWLQDIYSSLYGDDNRLAEDLKRCTQSILQSNNSYLPYINIALNIINLISLCIVVVYPLFGAISLYVQLLINAIGVAVTSNNSDDWGLDSIKVSSLEYLDQKFYYRDWVCSDNPEIIPADNIPYDVEIKTSNDFGADYGGEVYIQFVSESPESANGKTQDGSRLLSKTHKLIGEDFDAGSSNKYYVADKNIGDISKIILFTNSDNYWKLESLNLVVNGKKYKCKWNNWVNGTIELVPEKNANEAVYDIKIKTFNSIDDVKDIKDAIQIQFNGFDDSSNAISESDIFKKSYKTKDGFEMQDLFTNKVTKLQSVTITNTKDCKLPIDYLTINNQKYYVRQVISKDQSVVIDPSDKKSAYDIKFKISDIKNFDCKGKLKDNLFVKISGKDSNYEDVEINDELPLTLSDKDINSLTSGSEVKFYVASSTNIKDVEKVEIIRKNDINAPFLPLDYVDVVSNCIDKWGDAVEMPERRFNCGKYFRDSIVLSASDKVYKFDFKNLQDNQLQSLTAYSMSLGGKIDAGNTAANSDTVISEPFFPALDYNSNKSQEIIIGDSCKIDKLLCLDFASESSEPNKKWGLDYVTYNGIKANVNSSFSNEESQFRIDFTNRYCVTFYIKNRYNMSHLNFSIIGENKNETKKQDLANFKDDVAAFEDENNIDKIYGIKLESDSEIFLDSVEVNAPCGSCVFNCYRTFRGDLTLSVEDQVFDVEIKTGSVEYAGCFDPGVVLQFVNKSSNGFDEDDNWSRPLSFTSYDVDRKQAFSETFVLIKSLDETIDNFDEIWLMKNSGSDDWFVDYIEINGVIYYYRGWLSGQGQTITIDANSPMTAYNIDVKTSDIWQAGTDCDVSIILENYNGDKSDDISLDLKNVDDRGQNEINYYFIANNFGSNVDKCIVKVSDPGAWAFDYIKITQMDNAGKEKDSHTFYYGHWAYRSETVLSREDKIYSISTKEMDSTAGRAAEYSKNDSYDITLVDTTNKDNPRKSKVLSLPRQCAEKKCASLVHDLNEEPIFNVSYIDVHYVGDGLGTLDYVKVDNKTFYCREGIPYDNTKSLYEDYYPYDVCVFTGDRFNAGTDDDVSIKLYGKNSQKEGPSTDLMKLDTFWKNDFGRADFLPYNLKDKIELDTITKVEVNKKGSDDWGLDYLTVKLPNGLIYTFDYYDWVKDDKVVLYPNEGSSDKSPYCIIVNTGHDSGAGTDNDVKVILSGYDDQNKHVSTSSHILDLDSYNDFKNGSSDTYSFYDPVDLVTIDTVEFKLESSADGLDMDKWQVRSADVVRGDNRYFFDCKNEWISVDDQTKSYKDPKKCTGDSYCVIVKTADKTYAGTDGNISISVQGKNINNQAVNTAISHKLDKSGYDDFERKDCDTYFFVDDNKIDRIESITLSNDSSWDSWCVDSVKLIHNGRTTYEFICDNSWIGGGKDYPKNFEPLRINCLDNNINKSKNKQSFRIVTKILTKEWCGSCANIEVQIIGDKESTEFKKSPGSCDFDKGDWDSYTFYDKDIGDEVKFIGFKIADDFLVKHDKIGMEYIHVYYKNRWYKAVFNEEVDVYGKAITKEAKVIGVVPSR